MWKRALFLSATVLFFFGTPANATIFGNVRGIVHDPQHRPITGATVELRSATSDWSRSAQTNDDGEFSFVAVPVGDYIVTVKQSGFETATQGVTVISETSPVLHIPLRIAAVNQTAIVSAEAEVANMDSTTPTTLLSRTDVERTPGADRTNSLSMITDFVPGAYVTHDQLHIRGGHQVSWLIDGVPIPNSNIATNVGPQIDPKDIDYLEILRGSYDANYGDRTYGVFNIVPRTGFERNNEAELVVSAGNFYQTNDQLNFGSHTSRFAYFASLNGNRSNLGLQTPIGKIYHDAENGYGGFASLIYNARPSDQLRFVASARRDHYEIPYDPGDPMSRSLRDADREADATADFSWVHTISPNMYLTVSPFFHYNDANYAGVPNDLPVSTTADQASNYGGLQATLTAVAARNNLQAGVYGYGQRESQVFGGIFHDGSNPSFLLSETEAGGLAELFFDDKVRVANWLTLMAGLRQSHFTGALTEDATSPRFGATLQVPRLKWVFRAFYGRYYQPPPLTSISGPLLQYANNSNLSFAKLSGERDEEHQFGVTIPFHGWALDAGTFQTRARDFFDHNNIGESNIFIPVTIDGALIRAWEFTVRSPRLWKRGQVHLAYSNQVAQARGAITGGLICYPPADPSCQPVPGYTALDHDQRNTLNLGFDANLPWRAYASTSAYYGSGFSNGSPNQYYPGAYLPTHTTFDFSFGKSFGENYSVSVTALNIFNRRVLLDNSLTFGGFHFNDPREIYVEFRWRFHY